MSVAGADLFPVSSTAITSTVLDSPKFPYIRASRRKWSAENRQIASISRDFQMPAAAKKAQRCSCGMPAPLRDCIGRILDSAGKAFGRSARLAAAGDVDGRARVPEGKCDAFADAATSPGDDCHLSPQ